MTNINKKQTSLLIPVLLAGLFWVIYTFYLDDFLSADLRLLSSFLTEKILHILNVPCERNGTVLSGQGMNFEVIGACSGSTILKVMTGAGIFLSCSWQGIHLYQRIVFVLIAASTAILTNALRVTALVLFSLQQGSPVTEGRLHDTIGILTFILTFSIFCLCCYRLSKYNKMKKSNDNSKANRDNKILKIEFSITMLMLGILFFPFLSDLVLDWAGSSWDTSNQYGIIYFLFPLLLITAETYYSRKTNRLPPAYNLSLKILFVISLLLPVFANITDINLLAGAGLLLLILLVVSYYADLQTALITLPLLFIVSLSFPRIPLRLENILNDSNLQANFSAEGLRFILAGSITLSQSICYFVLLKVRKLQQDKKEPLKANLKYSSLIPFFFAISLIATAATLFISSQNQPDPLNQNSLTQLNLPYLVAEKWIGKDLFLQKTDISYFGKGNIVNREYNKLTDPQPQDSIEVLITTSGGDRHKNHPPEFCQSGSGWDITSKEKITAKNASERSVILVTLQKAAETKYMLYWFSEISGAEETNFSKMMLNDILSRLTGKKPEWLIIRLFSKSKNSLLDFLNHMSHTLLKTDRK